MTPRISLTDLPISINQPPQPDEQVALWDGRTLRRWVDVAEWERRIRADERARIGASPPPQQWEKTIHEEATGELTFTKKGAAGDAAVLTACGRCHQYIGYGTRHYCTTTKQENAL